MTTTPNLQMPYLIAAQAQKHVTHNEALRALDCLVQLSVLDKDLPTPPPTPANGARYIVAASPTGAWTGQVNRIAAWQDNAWAFYVPQTGWQAWVADDVRLYAYDGTAWVPANAVNPVAMLGVNTTADSSNRLAVASANSLFTHDGSDHRLKINRAAAVNTASVLLQSAFSGRAEIGLAGDDNLHLKVSADGSGWHEALVLVAATGTPRLRSSPVSAVPAAAAAGAGALIYVADESGGGVPAFSDGAAWRRFTDRAVIS
jgi:DNA-binding beta-propeller fold protein YncE